MLKKLKYAAAVTTLFLLAACGGGGGGGGSISATDPNTNFPLRQAISDYVTNGKSETFILNGRLSNTDWTFYTVNGELLYSKTAATSTTFEGRSAVRYTYAFSGDINYTDYGVGNAKRSFTQAFPSNTYYSYWDNVNYSELGSLSSSNYRVNSTITSTPAFVKVGSSGVLFSSINYLNSTKTTRQGTATSSYEVLSDTPTSVLLKITETGYSTSGVYESTEIDIFRLTISGTLERISRSASYATGGNMTFTRK